MNLNRTIRPSHAALKQACPSHFFQARNNAGWNHNTGSQAISAENFPTCSFSSVVFLNSLFAKAASANCHSCLQIIFWLFYNGGWVHGHNKGPGFNCFSRFMDGIFFFGPKPVASLAVQRPPLPGRRHHVHAFAPSLPRWHGISPNGSAIDVGPSGIHFFDGNIFLSAFRGFLKKQPLWG